MNIGSKKINLNGFRSIIKKYGYYAVLALSLTVLTLVVMLTAPTNDDVPTGGSAIVFLDPVANTTILKEYSDTALLYNQTLNQWEAHKALDFVAPEGADVLAVYGGTVQAIYTNYIEGTVVVIDHGDGLKTLYGSLDSQVQVEEGDTVDKGDVIGVASDSAMNEVSDGAHVHFEVWEDDTKVDPSAYLASAEK